MDLQLGSGVYYVCNYLQQGKTPSLNAEPETKDSRSLNPQIWGSRLKNDIIGVLEHCQYRHLFCDNLSTARITSEQAHKPFDQFSAGPSKPSEQLVILLCIANLLATQAFLMYSVY